MPLIVAGFIGFGEVGRTFSAALRERGVDVAAFDINRSRVDAGGVLYLALDELSRRADYVLSTVTTQSAVVAAEACAPHLRPSQFFVDLNSTSPRVKQEIAEIVAATDAQFVEGAILGAVGVTGAQTRILTGGAAGDRAAADLTAAGLRVAFYSPEVGKASTFKMLRSIFSKGLEALILELLISGRRAGMEQDLWADINELMSAKSFDKIAGNWVQTHPYACERRYHEMEQVVETMEELGVEPVMTTATNRFFERSKRLALGGRLGGRQLALEDVVSLVEQLLHQ
jgi:3-hydroxyisobutyrate dehydrogenase-like beta-hydroxyacid dehydrogenase